MLKHIDYNSISSSYNKRYLTSPLEGVRKELVNLTQSYSPKSIIEIGCGTGHWLAQLSGSGISKFGFDYSLGMLKKAKELPLSNLTCADANQLPIKPNSTDMIIAINAIHHFRNPLAFVKSVSAYLKDGGLLSIMGLDPTDKNTEWYLYHYFGGTYQYDLNRFPSFEDIRQAVEETQLKYVELKEVHTISYKLVNEEVLKDTFLEKNQASQLAALTEEEYNYGLNKIHKAIDKANIQKVELIFPVNLVFKAILFQKK